MQRQEVEEKSLTENYDLAIIGGRFTGLSLALSLKKRCRDALSLIVIEPHPARISSDLRASALTASSENLLRAINAWPEKAAQPIRSMQLTSSAVDDGVRPPLLHFEGQDEFTPLAHIIENRALDECLYQRALQEKILLKVATVTDSSLSATQHLLTLDDGTEIIAKCVCACDGAKSPTRERAHIPVIKKPYHQKAIITVIEHEKPHEGVAIQHFLENGPFAALPMIDQNDKHRSAIVWSEDTKKADEFLALPQEHFLNELARRLGHQFGALSLGAGIDAYPLQKHTAQRFIAERLALLGDAAHVVHPLAGQGLNLGLRDVAAFADVMYEALELGLDIGATDILERYEQWRRFDTSITSATMSAINTTFSNTSSLLGITRSAGMSLLDRAPFVKNWLIKNARGETGNVPSLMR